MGFRDLVFIISCIFCPVANSNGVESIGPVVPFPGGLGVCSGGFLPIWMGCAFLRIASGVFIISWVRVASCSGVLGWLAGLLLVVRIGSARMSGVMLIMGAFGNSGSDIWVLG